MTEALVFASALAASFLSGLLGIGGGIVLAPLLLYGPALAGEAELPVKLVTGLTVVQAIAGSMLGTWRHRGYGHVSRRVVTVMGPAAAGGAIVGAIASAGTPDRVLLAVFASVSFAAAGLLVLPPPAPPTTGEHALNVPLAVAIAGGLGLLGGMVGVGGIAFIIAVLVYVLRVPARVAIGTSLGIGLFGASAALLGKAATAQVDLTLATLVVGAALVGSPAGAWLSVRSRPRVLLVVLAVIVAASGLRIAWTAAFGI